MATSSASSVLSVPKKKVSVKSAENELLDLDEAVTLQSQTIKKLLLDFSGDVDNPIPLPNVRGNILTKVNEFCKKQLEVPDSSASLTDINSFKKWEVNFVKQLQHDLDTLYDLIEAANYLGIKSLLDRTCQCVADMMKGKKIQQVRDLFHIVNDYTLEVEEAVMRESTWVFIK